MDWPSAPSSPWPWPRPWATTCLPTPTPPPLAFATCRAHLNAARAGDLRPLAADALAAVGMFGWQGDPEWRYNLAGRPVFDPLGAGLFYAGFLIALWRFRRPEYAFLVIWLPANLLFSAITPPSPSTLRAIGGIAAAFAFPAISLHALWSWAGARWGRAARTADRRC